jgi:hypothetical protein
MESRSPGVARRRRRDGWTEKSEWGFHICLPSSTALPGLSKKLIYTDFSSESHNDANTNDKHDHGPTGTHELYTDR